MSAILDRAKAHYQAQPRREILVPEWGEPGKPARITWSELTVADQDRIYAPTAEGKIASGGAVRIRTLIFKACDEGGSPLFDAMAEHSLRYEVDGSVIARVANAILFGAGLVDAKGEVVSPLEQVESEKKD